MKMLRTTVLLIGVFVLLGLCLFSLRINFNLYPDSYYYLSGAKGFSWQNLTGYNSLYIGLTALLSLVFDIEVAAHLLSSFAGSLTIVLGGILCKLSFKKRFSLLAGMLLLATSWSIINWSRLVLTEGIALCASLAFIVLAYLWWKKKRKGWLLASLVVLLIACFTRREYVMLGLVSPLLIFIWDDTASLKRALRRTWPLLFTSIVLTTTLLALSLSDLLEIFKRNTSLIYLAIGFSALLLIVVKVLRRKINSDQFLKTIYFLGLSILVCLWIVHISSSLLDKEILGFPHYLNTIFEFVAVEFILVFFTVLGAWHLIISGKVRVLASVVTILAGYFVIYQSINPHSVRYLTHLIPFLLIPTFYGLDYIFSLKRDRSILFLTILAILAVLQIRTLFTPWLAGPDYHQALAEKMEISDKESSAVVSCAIEPFILYTEYNLLAMPPADAEEEFDIHRNSANYSDFYIIVDETAWDYCTGFSKNTIDLFNDKIYNSFTNDALYCSGLKRFYPEGDVEVYKLNREDIEKLLKFEYVRAETNLKSE